jgi:hypothetical protein
MPLDQEPMPGEPCEACLPMVLQKAWSEAVAELMETSPEFVENMRRLFGPESGYIGRYDATTGVFYPPGDPEEN